MKRLFILLVALTNTQQMVVAGTNVDFLMQKFETGDNWNAAELKMLKTEIGKAVDPMNVNKRVNWGAHPPLISKAIVDNNNEVFDILLGDKNIDLSITDNDNKTPIWFAVQYQREELLKKLLQSNKFTAKIMQQAGGPTSITPLGLAIQQDGDDLAYTNLLLTSNKFDKATVNTPDSEGHTPLFYVIDSNCQGDRLKKLGGLTTNSKIDINALDAKKNTVIHYVTGSKRKNLLEFATLTLSLEDLLANKNLKQETLTQPNDNGDTPLHFAVTLTNSDLMLKDIFKSAKFDKKTINSKNKAGETPLLSAMKQKLDANVKILLDNNASLAPWDTTIEAAQNTGDNTIIKLIGEAEAKRFNELHDAADKKDLTKFRALIDQVNLNPVARVTTPLHLACQLNDVQSVKEILKRGVRINAKDHDKKTPSEVTNNKEIKKLIKAKQEELDNALINALSAPNAPDKIASLVILGANIAVTDKDGNTLLHLACKLQGTIARDVANEIIKEWPEGSPVTIKNKMGNTPLHTACKEGNEEIVGIILDREDAPLTTKNNAGKTPLELAATEIIRTLLLNRQTKLNDELIKSLSHSADQLGKTPKEIAEDVKTLVSRGASISAQDSSGKTPLHLASKRGNKDAVEYLIKEGAAISAKDNSGLTPLETTYFYDDRQEIAKILIDHGASPETSMVGAQSETEKFAKEYTEERRKKFAEQAGKQLEGLSAALQALHAQQVKQEEE